MTLHARHSAPAESPFQMALAEFKDLCWNCNDAVLCLERTTLRRPVWFCEQFDSYVPVACAERARPAASRPPQNALAKGICTTCACQSDCQAVRTGQEIWFCENYT